MYLLAGRSPIFLNKHTRDLLASGDEIRQKTSKKDPKVRARELLDMISPDLIRYATEHTSEMLVNPFACKLLCETILQATKGEKIPILKNIIEEVRAPPSDTHIMFTFANHMIKVLVNGAHYRREFKKEQSSKVESDSEQLLSQETTLSGCHFPRMLFGSIREHLLEYATGVSSSFPVLALLESDETKEDVRTILMENVDELKQHQDKIGVKLILKELGFEIESILEKQSKVSRKRKASEDGMKEKQDSAKIAKGTKTKSK